MAKKFVKYVALLPLVRFGYPQRENQKIELEVNDKTNTMLELGYIVEVSKAKNADKVVDASAEDKADEETSAAENTEGSTEDTGA